MSTVRSESTRDGTLVLVAILAAVMVGAGAALAPAIATAALLAVTLLVYAAARIGLLSTIVVGSLGMLTVSGYATLYVPAASGLIQVSILALLVVSFATITQVRLSRWMRVFGSGFLVISTLLAVPSYFDSAEYAFRGWVGLTAATWVTIAVAGATSATRGLDQVRLRRSRMWILGVVVFAGMLNVALGVRQALGGLNSREQAAAILAGSTFEVGDRVRLMGAFSTNQEFGLFAACLSPAFLAFWLTWRGRSRHWFLLLATLLYVATFLSLTRTALIASVFVGMLMVLLWAPGETIVRAYKVLGAVIFGGFTVWMLVLLTRNAALSAALERMQSLFSLTTDVSYNARVSRTLPRALGILNENWGGLGAGAAGPVSAAFDGVAPRGKVTADNGYLMVAIQIGLAGGVLMVGMLWSTFQHLRRLATPFAAAGTAVILAVMVAMLTAGYWSLLAPGALVASLVGLGISAPTVRGQQPAPSSATFKTRLKSA